MRVLVTGGVRSGKSRHAEELLADRDHVTYLAPGPAPTTEDPEWTARVAAHRQRRPAHWTTVESTDLAAAIAAVPGAAIADCLGTWVTARVDWTSPHPRLPDRDLDALTAAVAAADDLVVVTNEVGLGVVPAHASGRLFRDLLGTVNQRVAAVCDEVHLVVAGRVLVL
ncbi:bifunctional adenosylcobinamide kinase/adenosylcobinamide-phosphate guanylyltransferase [Marmoricola sp. RAF53]|uniref:bifunctional adenosylcobinamide kinase/adenosylcobinamide-phosphate guanylyltransferase n=1 Tax=Marmoricola sp. RAF53 TaxID=3233059 RepID=UPI003F9818F3